MSRRISVRAIVMHEGKLLCVRLNPYNEVSATMRESWCTPGGGLDEGESLLAGLQREMVEETGIPPQIGELLYVQQFAYNNKEYLEFFFHVTNGADYLHVDLAGTSHGAAEIAEIAFVDPASTKILPTFLTTEPLAQKIAAPSPTTLFSSL